MDYNTFQWRRNRQFLVPGWIWKRQQYSAYTRYRDSKNRRNFTISIQSFNSGVRWLSWLPYNLLQCTGGFWFCTQPKQQLPGHRLRRRSSGSVQRKSWTTWQGYCLGYCYQTRWFHCSTLSQCAFLSAYWGSLSGCQWKQETGCGWLSATRWSITATPFIDETWILRWTCMYNSAIGWFVGMRSVF